MVHQVAHWISPYRRLVAFGLLAAIGETVADLLQPWPLKVVFDNVFGTRQLPPEIAGPISAVFGPGRSGVLTCALAAVVAATALDAVSTFGQGFVMTRVANWVLHDLRRQLYWHAQRLSLSYHDEKRTGDLMSTLTGDIQAVHDLIASALLGLIISVLTLGGMVLVMFVLNWRFALLALSIAPLLFLVVYRLTRRMKEASRTVRRQEGQLASIAQEVLSSIKVVQAFTREAYEQSRFEEESQRRVWAGVEALTLKSALSPLVDLLVAVGTVLVLWYGAQQVLAGALSAGSLLVFLAYLGRLYRPMRDLSKLTDVLYRASAASERITGLLAVPNHVQDSPRARLAPPFRGQIVFDQVRFSYPNGRRVLQDVSFTVDPGSMVAVVGSTGAGKTTLTSLIPRFSDPECGAVLVDGHDVRDYALDSLRSQISLVLQETVLFYGTVRDNIAYGRPNATRQQVIAAARAAHAHEFIERLPAGYDTRIGERGVTLSGGQRQRLAIARAMIRDAPIVLLDEPTTGLDASSEALVIDGMARLVAGRTVLVIAHRLSTIMRADLILVMEHGQIVERGTHDALLRLNGRYAELFGRQFGSSVPVSPAVRP